MIAATQYSQCMENFSAITVILFHRERIRLFYNTKTAAERDISSKAER